jgi:hypothetical protein
VLLPRGRVDAGDIVEVPKYAVRIETPDHEREIPRQDKTQEESALPQGRGESLIAQLDSAVNQAEQLRDQQIQQQYSDQLGIYVQEKAQQIYRLQSSMVAALTSEQAQLQAIQKSTWLDRRQKSARSVGAAGCATKDQDRADCAALG